MVVQVFSRPTTAEQYGVYACAEREGEVVLVFAKLDFAHDDIAEISRTFYTVLEPKYVSMRTLGNTP
jgi:hypothetical protein